MSKYALLLSLRISMCAARAFADENVVIHSVKKGETLSGIAAAAYGYKNMVVLIQAVNSIADANKIAVNQKLIIPTSSNFFLRTFKIHDKREKPVLSVYRNARTSRVYVGTNIKPREGEGNFHNNRFLLVCISEKPYKIVFDSLSVARAYKSADYMGLVDTWKIVDLDGDGDIDILGEFIQGSDCYLTQYCFHFSKDTYVPYAVIKDVSIGDCKHCRDKKGRMVFRYQLRRSEKEVVVEWDDVKKKGSLSRK